MKHINTQRHDLIVQNDIDILCAKVHKMLNTLRSELKSINGGNLYVKRSKKYTIYTEYFNGLEKSIGRNRKRVHLLARRKYILSQIHILKEYYKGLKSISSLGNRLQSDYNIDFLLNTFHSLDMNKILFSRQQQQWLNQPYKRNPAFPEDLKFETTNSILMRTKSELIIANKLEEYSIPYLPEMPLWFAYNFDPKYPDFTILKPNGEIIIWEHMGRMDKEDYFIKNSKKIVEYRQNGYSQNTNLIITFEEDISEAGIIDHIIKTRILS